MALECQSILVPAVWGLEIANAVLVGERQKRLRAPEVRLFTSLVQNLSLVQDAQPVGEYVNNVLPLAREYGLSAYDAAYLELSLRHGVPLATLDGKLQKAAERAGVQIFPGKSA